jgi:hypothetical protein
MQRLNERAWKILRQEVEKSTNPQEIAGAVQRQILFKRLDALHNQPGIPLTLTEIQETVGDILPNFNPEVLKKAAKANQPPKKIGKVRQIIGIATASIGFFAGLIWLVNLPYPMIRRPIARTAPILLLPSYISMDRNYRQAISNVEQADQLVNQATSLADIKLGEKKVKIAQENLEKLPVWFLGYEPVFYCRYFSCGWNFTFDEFQDARKNIGRMQAIVFQENNAFKQLQQAEANLEKAKQQYQQATNSPKKQDSLIAWQASLDRIEQLPPPTLAARIGQTKLEAYQRDFQQVTGWLASNQHTNTLINAAKEFAMTATNSIPKPPYSAARWQQAEDLWKQAIERLERVPVEDAGYLDAQRLLATYQKNLSEVQIRRQEETSSVETLTLAKNKINNLLAERNSDRNLIISNLQSIIDQLQQVKLGTTVYPEAQTLLKSAQKKLQAFLR